jgi:predicted acetyltransferase
MAIEIRTLRDDSEIGAWSDAVAMGFLRPGQRGHVRENHPLKGHPERGWAAFDGTRVVGTLRSLDVALTVPGGVVNTCGISGVSVLPGHRRKGLLGRMISGELAAARERGDVVSTLISAAWPIYGRFGYGPAADYADYRVDTRAAVLTDAATAGADAAGTVNTIDAAAFRAEAPAVYDRMRLRTVGAVDRQDSAWDRRAGIGTPEPGDDPENRVFAVLRDTAGTVRGYVDYRIDAGWHDGRAGATITVVDLIADDTHAETALWRYLWDHDWVHTVEAGFRRVDEPLRWQLRDGRAVTQTKRRDALWVLPLDVPAALSARGYAIEGKLTFRVVPPAGARESYGLPPARAYVLDGGPDGARCHATTGEAELTLPLDALGALYLGGTTATSLAKAGLVTGDAVALARADLMFATATAPWCNTIF